MQHKDGWLPYCPAAAAAYNNLLTQLMWHFACCTVYMYIVLLRCTSCLFTPCYCPRPLLHLYRLASRVSELCWDAHYSPPPIPWGVPSTISLTFEEGFTCPKTPQQIASLQQQLDKFSQQLAAGSGGVISGIHWGRYTPAACQVRC